MFKRPSVWYFITSRLIQSLTNLFSLEYLILDITFLFLPVESISQHYYLGSYRSASSTGIDSTQHAIWSVDPLHSKGDVGAGLWPGNQLAVSYMHHLEVVGLRVHYNSLLEGQWCVSMEAIVCKGAIVAIVCNSCKGGCHLPGCGMYTWIRATIWGFVSNRKNMWVLKTVYLIPAPSYTYFLKTLDSLCPGTDRQERPFWEVFLGQESE